MANSIRLVQDQQGNNVFPITHERAVRDSSGVRLDIKLNTLEGELAQLFINVAEDGLYFVDVNYNIGAYIDGTGMHTINQLEYIKIQ